MRARGNRSSISSTLLTSPCVCAQVLFAYACVCAQVRMHLHLLVCVSVFAGADAFSDHPRLHISNDFR
jgi:hypothetical protein